MTRTLTTKSCVSEGTTQIAGRHRPDISVVICTRNRAAFLRQALEHYERIFSHHRWELIIVNNSSTDGTRAVADDFASSTSIHCRVIDESQPGLSRARNTGWRNADAEIIAFTDDDCYPLDNFISQVATVLAEPMVGYYGGMIRLFDPNDQPITILEVEDRIAFPPSTLIEPGQIQGANMGARRSVLEAVGGFDEELGAGTAFPSEDIDFVVRASFSGFLGVYDPRPVVLHHHRRQTTEQASLLAAQYSRGRGAFYMSCLLDNRRRTALLKKWYWSLTNCMRGRSRCGLAFPTIAGEICGALGYLGRRITQSADDSPRDFS